MASSYRSFTYIAKSNVFLRSLQSTHFLPVHSSGGKSSRVYHTIITHELIDGASICVRILRPPRCSMAARMDNDQSGRLGRHGRLHSSLVCCKTYHDFGSRLTLTMSTIPGLHSHQKNQLITSKHTKQASAHFQSTMLVLEFYPVLSKASSA